jgi:hypothetical protein
MRQNRPQSGLAAAAQFAAVLRGNRVLRPEQTPLGQLAPTSLGRLNRLFHTPALFKD